MKFNDVNAEGYKLRFDAPILYESTRFAVSMISIFEISRNVWLIIG